MRAVLSGLHPTLLGLFVTFLCVGAWPGVDGGTLRTWTLLGMGLLGVLLIPLGPSFERARPAWWMLALVLLPLLIATERGGLEGVALWGEPERAVGLWPGLGALLVMVWVALRGLPDREALHWWLTGAAIVLSADLLVRRFGLVPAMPDEAGWIGRIETTAGALAVLAPFLGATLLARGRPRPEVSILAGALVFLVIAVGASGQPGAAGATFAGLGIVIWRTRRASGRRRVKRLGLLVGIGVPLAALSLATAAPAWKPADAWPREGSISERRAIHDRAVSVLTKSTPEQLWLGRGHGGVARAFDEQASAEGNGFSAAPRRVGARGLVYDQLIERGLIGLLLQTAFFAFLFLRGWIASDPARAPALGALVAHVLHRTVADAHPLGDGLFAIVAGLLLAAPVAARPRPRWSRRLGVFVPLIVWGITLLLPHF